MPNFYGGGSTGQKYGGPTTTTKYSPARDFYSRNLVYGSGTGMPKRPFEGIGKFSVSLLGQGPTQPDAERQAFLAGAQHPLDAMGPGKIPILGDILKTATDWTTKIPDITPGNLALKLWALQAWEAGKNNAARDPYEQRVMEGWMDAGEAQAEFFRSQWKENSPIPLLADFVTPTQNIGEGALRLLNMWGLPQMAMQRAVLQGGDNGLHRLETLRVATNEQLQNKPELMSIRDDWSRHRISKDEALDALWEAGFLMSNPADPVSSFGMEMLSDPVNYLTLGTAGLARQGLKSGVRLIGNLTKELGQEASTDILRSFAAKNPGRVITPNMTKEFVDEALLNPATSAATQEVINKAGRRTRFWTGTGTTSAGAAAEAERLLVQRLAAPTIIKYGRWAEKVLDPLTLFGRDDAGKGSMQVISRAISEGAIEPYGWGTNRALQQVLKANAGREVAEQLDEYIGRAAMQTAAQVGVEGYVRKTLGSQAFDPVDNVTDLALQSAHMYGSDVGRYVRDKVETVMYRVVPKEGETMAEALELARGEAKKSLKKMFALSDQQADAIMKGQGERFISLIHYAHFGYSTKTFIAAAKKAGTVGDSYTYLGPRQLSRKTLKEFVTAVNKKEMVTVRAMIRQYDQLYFNLTMNQLDDDLIEQSKVLAAGLADKVPNEITKIDTLPPALRAWARAHPGYKMAFKPKDQWGSVIDKESRVVGLNPWVDWVDDMSAPVRMNAAKVKWMEAMRPIAASSINRRAMHRFIQRMGESYGFDEQTSTRMFWSISDRAEVNHVTVRGLERSDFYAAAREVKMPAAMRRKLTEREMAEATIWAFEGELGQVGITQKITGKAKTKLSNWANAGGQMAEKIYPLVRFKYNPFHQLTEVIETPVLLAGRGVWPGGSKKLLNAKTQYVRSKLAMYGNGLYKGDMMEYSDNVLASGEAVRNLFSEQTQLGRLLRTAVSVQGIKRAGENSMFRHEMGRMFVQGLKRQAPGQLEAIAEWNFQRGLFSTVDDGETAIHMLFDAFSRADPEGALKAVDPEGVFGAAKVFGEHGPAAFRPQHLGKKPRVETSLIRYLAVGDGWQDMTWLQLRRRLRDPADTDYKTERLEQEMRSAGADEDYIARTMAMVTFPTPSEFYRSLVKMGFPKEQVNAIAGWSDRLARMGGMTHDEFLSRTFADVPQTVDSAGNFRGRSLFQRILTAHEARGIKVPKVDGPEVKAVVDAANEVVPTFTHRTSVPISELSTLEKKSRDWTRAHDARQLEPTEAKALGVPMDLVDQDGNTIVFLNGAHKSGQVEPQEWVKMLETVLTKDQIREAADWYGDMRRAFVAQYDNDTDGAVKAILGFALTQKNTSPAMGMSHLFAALEKVRRGERLPVDQKFDGLATAELKRLLEDDMMTDAGLAQKLTDFIDSLLGNRTRTAGIGNDLSWMPAAIDIWAKRDMGFLDHSIKVSHWKRITGASEVVKVRRVLLNKEGKPITRLNKAGERVEVTTQDVVLTFSDGRTQTIRGESLSQGQPTDLQYDYGVERYNLIAADLNERAYLGRENWLAADVQAMGWFRAKVAFGDDTGDPLDSFFRNHYNVTFEVAPGKGTKYADLYPGLANDGRVPITEAQMAAITSDVMDTSVHEAARISGVQIMGRFAGKGTWVDDGGVANITPNVTVEVFGTDDGVRRFMAALGTLNQQNAVAATKTVAIKTKPSKTNGMRWAYDWPLPSGISKTDADELYAELIAHDDFAAGGSALIRYDNGQYAVRAVWVPEEGVPHWLEREFEQAAPSGERMSLTYTGSMYDYTDEGYRRGRYVDQAELDETQAWGARIIERLDNAETDEFVDLTEEMVTDIMARVRETPWNGVTYNLRRAVDPETPSGIPPVGALPKGKPGKGPYITGAGITRSETFQNVTEARFRAALNEFVEENRAELSKRGRYLGVFRDEDSGRFDFDVAYATWDEDEAEALQLALGREGGAYDTFSGNGVYAPVLRPDTVPARAPVTIQPTRTRVYSHFIEEKDYASEIHGAGRRGAGRPTPSAEWVVGDSDRRVRAATERAYRTHAGYETQAFRAERLAQGDGRYTQSVDELDDITAEPNPARLFQRAPRGFRAATEFESNIPAIGVTSGRASLHFRPGRSARDTLLHEFVHSFSQHLDDSAKSLYLASYNARSRARRAAAPKPGNGARRVARKNNWDEDVHEAFANDVVEYFRTGEPVEAELKPLFDYYGKYLRASRNRPGLTEDTKKLLDQIVGTNKYKGGVGYNPGQQLLMDMAFGQARRAERNTNDLIYFKGERSWMERSFNHPYLALYPLSYMWGKILPELVEFLAFRPFGLKAPFVALHNVNKMYQSLMTEIEENPELREWLDTNEPYLRAMAMLVPGVPWDLPVNAPLWMRHLIEQMEENAYKEQAGLKYKPLPELLADYSQDTLWDTLGYMFGPVSGGKNLVKTAGAAVGLASQAVGGGFNALVPEWDSDAEAGGGGWFKSDDSADEAFDETVTSSTPLPVTSRPSLEQQVEASASTVFGGQSPEQVEATLLESLYPSE